MAAAAGASQPQAGAASAATAAVAPTVLPEESSDSEPEQEPGSPQKLIRKVSTSGQIRQKVRAGEGLQGSGLEGEGCPHPHTHFSPASLCPSRLQGSAALSCVAWTPL